MLIPASDDSTDAIGGQECLTGRCCVVWAGFQSHGDWEFTVSTFDNAYQAVTGAVLVCPGIVIHPLIRPGVQSFDRHEISEHYFSRGAGKFGLQYIATAQVVMCSGNGSVCWGDLKVSTLISVEQTAEDS